LHNPGGLNVRILCGMVTFTPDWEGRCNATWKNEFKLPWREAGPPNYLIHKGGSDQ
jgi:hypothetical protein